jgi:hypothetical protein
VGPCGVNQGLSLPLKMEERRPQRLPTSVSRSCRTGRSQWVRVRDEEEGRGSGVEVDKALGVLRRQQACSRRACVSLPNIRLNKQHVMSTEYGAMLLDKPRVDHAIYFAHHTSAFSPKHAD